MAGNREIHESFYPQRFLLYGNSCDSINLIKVDKTKCENFSFVHHLPFFLANAQLNTPHSIKINSGKDGPVKSAETVRAGLSTHKKAVLLQNSNGKERQEDYPTSGAYTAYLVCSLSHGRRQHFWFGVLKFIVFNIEHKISIPQNN